jgi:DNA-binding response OmpR family regulator
MIVAQRDYERVVIAEDDQERASEMMKILTVIGGFDISITKWRAEVNNLVSTTNAGWLILDLNLEDGNSAEIVPLLRERYGDELIIIILSGYYEDYPEWDLLSCGADLYLRKPYRPKAMLQQMETLRARIKGQALKRSPNIKLKIGDGVLDLERAIYKRGTTEIGVPHVQIKLIRLLASARDDEGWKFVERPEIIMHVWGEDFEVDPITTTERLRKLRNRIRRTLGMEITDSTQSGSKRLPRYRLISDIEIIEE